MSNNIEPGQRIQSALTNQAAKTVTVLSSLLAVEDEIGYIPPEAIDQIAQYTKSTINDVWAVASFYTNFRFTPPGDHVVEVCWGPTCHLLGAQFILKNLLEALDMQEEGDTEDSKISLKYNTCLGACSQGPVVSLDHKIIGSRSMQASDRDTFSNNIVEMVSGWRHSN